MSDLALGSRPTKTRLFGAVTGAAVVLAAVAGYLLVTHLVGGRGGSDVRPRRVAENVSVPLVSAAGLAQRSGVRLSQVAVTGAGGLIDLRYQVVDPDRAASVHDPSTKPLLIDERSGLVVNELLMGHMHHGRLNAGQSYYLIFVNPGNLVRPGARVMVQLGDARVAHIRMR